MVSPLPVFFPGKCRRKTGNAPTPDRRKAGSPGWGRLFGGKGVHPLPAVCNLLRRVVRNFSKRWRAMDTADAYTCL